MLEVEFALIKGFGPKANLYNSFVEWSESEINDPIRTIFGCSASLVEKSLANYPKGSILAVRKIHWPLTLRGIKLWFIQGVLEKIWGPFLLATYLLIGLPCAGKSQISKILGILLAMFHIRKDESTAGLAFRCAQSLDVCVASLALSMAAAYSTTSA